MTRIMSIDYAKAIEEKGIRPSVQRTAIFGYISENKTHPTVDNVYTALSPSYPTLSRTTVYNTLKLFAEKNLVQVLKIEDDELRYDSVTKPHIHFKCRRCGRIFDVFDDERIGAFNKECSRLLKSGFKIESIQTSIWGTCSDCSNS